MKNNTYASVDNMYRVRLIVEWNEEGSKIAEQVTRRIIGKPLAIFTDNKPLLGHNGSPIAPIVKGVFPDRWPITGVSFREAYPLSKQLNVAGGKG